MFPISFGLIKNKVCDLKAICMVVEKKDSILERKKNKQTSFLPDYLRGFCTSEVLVVNTS